MGATEKAGRPVWDIPPENGKTRPAQSGPVDFCGGASLRWHYPNQVRSRGKPLLSAFSAKAPLHSLYHRAFCPVCQFPKKAGDFALAARAPCAGGARFLFAEKKPGKEKAERGTSRSPLHSPPKGRPFNGAAPFFAVTDSLCGYLSCMAVQRFPHRRKAWFKWHRTGAIPPQQKFSPVAHWGECRGGSAPSALSFPPLSLAKKAVLPPSRRPARRAQKPPA